MQITGLEGAAAGNADLRNALTDIQLYLTLMADQLGINPRAAQQATGQKVAPPAQVVFTATGVNGMYVVAITNPAVAPNQQSQTIYHQVRTASDTPIEHPVSYDDTPTTPNTHIVIPDPNATKYIGVRSKFINSAFNNWRVLPAAVYSGSVSAASLPTADVIRQISSGNSALLYQNGPIGEIDWPTLSIQFPGVSPVVYEAGSIGGLTMGLTYYVYVDDAQRTGGTLQFYATINPLDLAASEDRIYIGMIRLRDTGGGLSLPFGVRGGAAAGTIIHMAGQPDKLIDNLQVGDLVVGVAPISNETVASVTPLGNIPCFTVTSSSGKSVTVSSDVALQLGPGSRFPVIDMVTGDEIDTKDGQEQVASKVYAGLQVVYMVELSFNRFIQGNGIWVGC